MTLIHGRLEIPILGCRLLPRELLGGWRHFPSVLRSSFLFRSRLRFHPIGPVKAGTVTVHLFIHHRAVDKGVMHDGGIHARHGGVITERVSFPSAAPVAVSGVAMTVVNASVKTDSRAPVAFIKRVSAVVEAPVRRCPKQTHCWWSDPNAWDPIIIHVSIAPVTGSPHIAFDRTGRLLHDRQNRRSNIDRYAYLCERGRQR